MPREKRSEDKEQKNLIEAKHINYDMRIPHLNGPYHTTNLTEQET